MNREIIIEKIKSHRRYSDNKDLLDDIVNAVISRLDDVIESIKDDNVINSLIDKTINKTIIDLLKSNNRISQISNTIQKVNYQKFGPLLENHRVPTIPLFKLKQLYNLLKKSDENNDTLYLKIIDLMYEKKYSVEEIANSLNTSTTHIIDILFELSENANKVSQV